jgi:hypothetical protein
MMKVLMGLGAAALAAFATVFALAFAGGADATAASVRTVHRPAAAHLRGPCDEAEHAADPRCTGAATAQRRNDDQVGEEVGDDNRAGENERADDRGHHRGHDDDSGNGDRSGSNSGRG